MFELNDAMKQWHRSFKGRCSAEDMEELEAHLLEVYEGLKGKGLPEDKAFAQAVARMGAPSDLGREFAKVKSWGDWLRDRFRVMDGPLLLGLVVLSGIGLTMAFSADTAGYRSPRGIWVKQAVWIGLGFGLMFVVAQLSPVRLKRYTPLIYGCSIALLLLVLVFGVQINGARSWLRLPGLMILPSVLMLLTVPMMTAWGAAKREWAETWAGFGLLLLVTLLPVMLILLQPEIGMALLCLGAGWITLFLSLFRAHVVKLTCVAMPLMSLVAWLWLHAHQRHRILAWLNPEIDPNGLGWHALRLQETVAAGGMWGRGWLSSEGTLPAQHTDFVLSLIAEEFGLLGVLALLACFALVLYRSVGMIRQSSDTFCRLLGLGFLGAVCLQLLGNVSVIFGLLPIIGLPLPLVSCGGSSLVLLLMGFGILASINAQAKSIESVSA
jgi:rod shape determining protein RodA